MLSFRKRRAHEDGLKKLLLIYDLINPAFFQPTIPTCWYQAYFILIKSIKTAIIQFTLQLISTFTGADSMSETVH